MQTYADSLPTVSGPTSSNTRAKAWHRHEEPAQCENEHEHPMTKGVPWFGYCSAAEAVS